MKTRLLSFPGNETFAQKLASTVNASVEDIQYRHFPDGETYIRYEGKAKGGDFAIVCTLDRPDSKFLALCYLASLLKDLGAKRVGLIAPYLSYMRQDIAFHPGEAVTSKYFAQYLSQHFHWLLTVDPHLHRRKNLAEIYTIPTQVVHASSLLSQWVKSNLKKALLVGPDEESRQWVSEVAQGADVPFVILKKERFGDRDVEVSVPEVEAYQDHTPVLIDDIVSSGRTMIETIKHLKSLNMKSPICLAVHPIFAGDSFQDLESSGAHILSCNTIAHVSNAIDVSELIRDACLQSEFFK